VHHLVGVAEIAEMLGVSRQRVNAIVATHSDFPAPEAVLAAGRIWSRTAVEAWARANGRAIHQRGNPA
jgi:plasmid maintenance system antidote protein VapI